MASHPCYHSRDANKVRVDGAHTVQQVEAQMQLPRERRGSGRRSNAVAARGQRGGQAGGAASDGDHVAVIGQS
jgi:hypothetical protein